MITFAITIWVTGNLLINCFTWHHLQQTLPKEQQVQGIEYFDSLNNFSSKQKLQDLKPWSNFRLVFFCKWWEIHVAILINPYNNHPTIWTKFNRASVWLIEGQGKAIIELGSNKNQLQQHGFCFCLRITHMAVKLTTPGRARRGWVKFGEFVLIFTRQGHISQVSQRALTQCSGEWLRDGLGKAMIGLGSEKKQS